MRSIRRYVLCALATAGLATLVAETTRAQDRPEGPVHLITAYRCAAKDRPAFHRYLEEKGVKNFEQWKKSGAIGGYRILFNAFADADTWDALTVVTFPNYAASEEWWALVDSLPGGLDSAGLTLAAPIYTYAADRAFADSSAIALTDSADAIYFVIPYEYSEKGAYKEYWKAYVEPQFTGWIADGAVSRYEIFLNHHATGEAWDVLFILEYRNLEQFGRRDVVKQSVRARLRKENPEWQQIHADKHSTRVEGKTSMTRAVLP